MSVLCWICEFVAHWWGVIGDNSGQIQIILAMVALIVAIVALFKVLKQIDISNDQTKESIKQTGISIDQMTQLKKERLFEIILRLKGVIWEMEGKFDQLTTDFINIKICLLEHFKEFQNIDTFNVSKKLEDIEENLTEIREIKIKLAKYSISMIIYNDDIDVMENYLKEVFELNDEYNHYCSLFESTNDLVNLFKKLIKGDV